MTHCAHPGLPDAGLAAIATPKDNAAMNNTLTALLGTEYPLIQAPMAGAQGAALAPSP